MKKEMCHPGIILCSIVLFFSVAGCSQGKNADSGDLNRSIANAIKQDSWTFVAQNVNPQSGSFRHLTSKYYVNFQDDSLSSELPYFGRAYAGADVMTTGNPLGFISTKMSVVKDKNEKGAWVITVRPRDVEAVHAYIFTVYDNGTASLMVTMANRSPISFNGIVEPGRS